eukprot:727240-Pyramimonas_sp.AAC.1
MLMYALVQLSSCVSSGPAAVSAVRLSRRRTFLGYPGRNPPQCWVGMNNGPLHNSGTLTFLHNHQVAIVFTFSA